jgi:hypothetical protein
MRRLDLLPDCGSCAAICCVTTGFDAGEDFAFAKPAGVACRHLTPDLRCAVHDELVGRGLRGCAAYDCYGAGQKATRAGAGEDGFRALRDVHELLWLLTEAQKLCPPAAEGLAARLDEAIAALDALAAGRFAADLGPHRERAHGLLRAVGAALRSRP